MSQLQLEEAINSLETNLTIINENVKAIQSVINKALERPSIVPIRTSLDGIFPPSPYTLPNLELLITNSQELLAEIKKQVSSGVE